VRYRAIYATTKHTGIVEFRGYGPDGSAIIRNAPRKISPGEIVDDFTLEEADYLLKLGAIEPADEHQENYPNV
jgi:hypothetical protein